MFILGFTCYLHDRQSNGLQVSQLELSPLNTTNVESLQLNQIEGNSFGDHPALSLEGIPEEEHAQTVSNDKFLLKNDVKCKFQLKLRYLSTFCDKNGPKFIKF